MFKFNLIIFVITGCGSSRDGSDAAWPLPGGPHPKQLSDKDECRQFIAALPHDYIHDWIEVPEDPSNPKSPTLHIFYYGRIKQGQTPIMVFNGGPAEDSHGDYQVLTHSTPAALNWSGVALLFMDQRGNGCSSGYPQGNSDETLARLRFYGSSGIVADAEAIRGKLLGSNGKWRIYGQSYGAWIAHRYVELAPESLSGAFAHANVITPDPMERVANRIFSQNRVLEEYFKRYPTDRETLQALHTELTPSTCFPNATAKLRRCGLDTIYTLTQRFPFVPRWDWIHNWLRVLVKNGAINTEKMSEFIDKIVFYSLPDPSNLKSWPTIVIDDFDRNVPPFNRPTCEEIYRRLRSRGETPENYLLHECMIAMQLPANQHAIQDREERLTRFRAAYGDDHMTLDAFKQTLQTHLQLPFYLYSGYLDTMVPEENFPEELRALSGLITYRSFSNSGHDGFYSEAQVVDDILGPLLPLALNSR